MADDIDRAATITQELTELAIRNTASDIAPGVPGDCETCGEYSTRLIQAMCAPCRDKYIHKYAANHPSNLRRNN